MENKKVVLKAEELFGGDRCPVCGGFKKTREAHTCYLCVREIGVTATKAVKKVTEMLYDAMIGNAAANSGNVVRGNVWGKPVLANLKLDRDAIFHPAKGDIQSYWECRRTLPGRFFSIFIFGILDDKRGQEITGLVELKIKNVKGNVVHYLRVQIVEGVKSDVKIVVLKLDENEKLAKTELGLPSHVFEGEGYGFAVGFLPEKTKSAACAA